MQSKKFLPIEIQAGQGEGELRIVGVSEGRIPCPLGKTVAEQGRWSCTALWHVQYGESVYAICYWFGVDDVTLWKWRKALDVPDRNYGTRQLWKTRLAEGGYRNGIKAAVAQA